MAKNSWTTLDSTVEYQNPFMRIRRDKVIRPDGSAGTYYVLERESFSIIIPLTDSGETFLVGQYSHPIGRYSWEFPMGSVKGKTPLKTARQELLEETGIRARVWKKVGKFFVANGHSSSAAYVFLAAGLSYGKSQPEADEFLRLKKVAFAQIDRMIKMGKILDGPTIAALNFYREYRI